MSNEPKKTQLGWVPQHPDWYTQQQQQAQYAPTMLSQPAAQNLDELVARGHYDDTQPQDVYAQQQYAQEQQYAQQYYAQQQQYAQQQYAQQPAYVQQDHAQQVYPQVAQYPQAYAPVAAYQPPPVAPSVPPVAAEPQRNIAGADATVDRSDRRRFIKLTYLHLLGAILAFATLSWLFQTNEFLYTKISAPFTNFATATRYNWGIVLGVFVVVSWVADFWASHAKSRAMQYLGLLVYTIAETLIFVPLLLIVQEKTAAILASGGEPPHILRDSAFVTLGIFGMLTLSVLITKKDFSFLRSGLMMLSGAAMMLIVCSIVFGLSLGLIFSIAMVLLAAGYILYQTSQVLAHYDPRSYVAAALALFSSVALMFWYIIRIMMRLRQ